MILIDDITPVHVFSESTVLADLPSYTLEDDLELTPLLNFDNTSDIPRCLIHCINMEYVFLLDSQTSHWKCPLCEPRV